IVAANSELQTNGSKLDSTKRVLRDNDEMTDNERKQKQNEVIELGEKVKGIQDQLKLMNQKADELKIRSPIDGRVVTWNVRDRLLDRPVNKGESLLEIADPSQEFELEVEMPEKRMGHLAKAATLAGGKLPVTFFLATNPSQRLDGQVIEIERSAEVRG